MAFLVSVVVAASGAGVRGVHDGAGSDWTRLGPWNIFDGTDPTKSATMGETRDSNPAGSCWCGCQVVPTPTVPTCAA